MPWDLVECHAKYIMPMPSIRCLLIDIQNVVARHALEELATRVPISHASVWWCLSHPPMCQDYVHGLTYQGGYVSASQEPNL